MSAELECAGCGKPCAPGGPVLHSQDGNLPVCSEECCVALLENRDPIPKGMDVEEVARRVMDGSLLEEDEEEEPSYSFLAEGYALSQERLVALDALGIDTALGPNIGQCLRPKSYRLSVEGPWKTRELALAFAQAEVGRPWVLVTINRDWWVAVELEDGDDAETLKRINTPEGWGEYIDGTWNPF